MSDHNHPPKEDLLSLPVKGGHLYIFEDSYHVSQVKHEALFVEEEVFIKIANADGDEAAAYYLNMEDLPKLTRYLRRVYQKYQRRKERQ